MSTFVRATKQQNRLRLALTGPSKSGKTYSALRIATALGEKVALIDTEHGKASLYADEFEFGHLILDSFHPSHYIEGIRDAEQEGYDVLIIDSLSHAWMGKDGVLEFVDETAKRSQSGNSFAAWREGTPLHNSLVEAILASPLHVIATMRSKSEYVIQENSKGKKEPKKIGLAPIQRDGIEFEFDVAGTLDTNHNLIIEGTRCHALDGAVIKEPGAELAATLRDWLSEGAVLSEGGSMLSADLTPQVGVTGSAGLDRQSGSTKGTAEPPSESTSPKTETTINEAQATRLWTLVSVHHVPENEVRTIMTEVTGDAEPHTMALTKSDYDLVCARIESWVPPVLTGADGEA